MNGENPICLVRCPNGQFLTMETKKNIDGNNSIITGYLCTICGFIALSDLKLFEPKTDDQEPSDTIKVTYDLIVIDNKKHYIQCPIVTTIDS